MNFLWLPKTVKKITSGIDNRDNKQFMLHKSLISFFTIRQGEIESNNSFLNRFKSNVQNLELVGGSNFLYIIEHLELSDGEVVTDADRKKAREKFLAIFLKISDLKRYCCLL